MKPTPVLETGGLEIGYPRRRRPPYRVGGELALELDPGELVCVLGPNGAGKSTLLRTLAGMQPPLAGWIRLLGEDLDRLSPTALARRVSVVLTEPLTMGNLTARTLVSLGRYPYTGWMGRLADDDWRRVDQALAALSAEDLASRPVGELSDGERQKVMIARALAQEPKLMILDEPTAYLDLPRRIETLALLRGLTREVGCSVLLATHHLDLAMHYADLLWLQPAAGDLVSGAPEDLAMNGALERTFTGEGLRFDPERGEFRFEREESDRRIGLEGDGLARVWTRHALRREGFEVVSGDDAADLVRVEESGDGCLWRWRLEGGDGESTTIADLVRSLRLTAAPATPRAATRTSSR